MARGKCLSRRHIIRNTGGNRCGSYRPEIVQYAWGKEMLAEDCYREAFSSRGMGKILCEISEREGDGYEFIKS